MLSNGELGTHVACCTRQLTIMCTFCLCLSSVVALFWSLGVDYCFHGKVGARYSHKTFAYCKCQSGSVTSFLL